MTPRDGDASNFEENELNENENDLETTPVEESQHDWIQSEGYTPLSELGEDNAIFMAALPAENDGSDDAVFVFHAQPNDINSYCAESPESEHISIEMVDHNHRQEDQDGQQDFRLIADEALNALEEDYNMTIRERNIVSEEKTNEEVENAAVPTNNDIEKDETRDIQSSEAKIHSFKLPSASAISNVSDAKIDTEAVQRAVASIETRGAQVTQRFQQWQQQQQATSMENHPLIPPAPLSAFLKSTRKAKDATANLSRPATIADCLCKLQILDRLQQSKNLIIHVVGVDYVETQSVEKIQSTFGPLVRWIAAATSSSSTPMSISILLIGPNVVHQNPVDLRPKTVGPKSSLQSATATCHTGNYHESDVLNTSDPHLAIAFNAGIWGYDDWIPTLKSLKGKTFVVTAYTLEEAEDDGEVLREYGSKEIWAAQPNPFGSRIERETKTSPGNRVYRENAAWQAW
eukprot:CAMPEP_0194242654 /NCGR_PEP_ID=MMETSP0158-20130606/8123_1 /TAXON_ID=33649 /ORGANISM="Thalassionema nitzschioides, Strain L26-B" /LENGTH=459 /DNA_ID=CAMNT_0038977795 /DNA_START=9 /DNA_END=1385 /DNA_ORIENTATION=+